MKTVSPRQLADSSIIGRVVGIGVTAFAWSFKVVRPDDMLVLRFTLVNMKRDGDTVVRDDAAKPAYLIVEHQPQAIADATVPELHGQGKYAAAPDLKNKASDDAPATPDNDGPPPATVGVRGSGPSRVAYKMPAGGSIPWSLAGLLEAARTWALHLDASAQAEAPERTRFGSYKLSWLAHDLRAAMLLAHTAADPVLTDHSLSALDRVAATLAERTVAGVRQGQPPSSQALRETTLGEVDRALAGSRDLSPEMHAAAEIYVRVSATRRAVAAFRADRGGIVASLVQVPDYLALFLRPHEPGPHETALEMPYRLIGSPVEGAGFTHALLPVEHGERTELWHSRLGARDGASGMVDEAPVKPMRFLWSPDYDVLAPPQPAGPRLPLDWLDRQMIVKLTAGFDEKMPASGGPVVAAVNRQYVPRPLLTRKLMLSALGGTLDGERVWTERPRGVDLSAWVQRTSLARDQFVRVEYSGFLLPFGHAATLVKISERKFQWTDAAKTDRVAILRQRYFLIVREKVRSYTDAHQPDGGRSMPFVAVECLTRTTPDIDPPGELASLEPGMANRLDDGFYVGKTMPRMAFWPQIGQHDFRFALVGVDRAGRRVPFDVPLMFVSELENVKTQLSTIAAHYNKPQNRPRRQMPIRGATVRLADAGGAGANDVDLPANMLELFGAAPVGGIRTTQEKTLQLRPLVKTGEVKLAALQRLTGTERVAPFEFDPDYLAKGFGGNPAELFARITDANPFGFGGAVPSDKVGGLATPDLLPSALSRAKGVVSGALDDFKAGVFNPADFFGGAKLLGFFSLADLLELVDLGDEVEDLIAKAQDAYQDARDQLEKALAQFEAAEAGAKAAAQDVVDNAQAIANEAQNAVNQAANAAGEAGKLVKEAPKILTAELPTKIETTFRLVQDIPDKTIADTLSTGVGGQSRFTLVSKTTLPLDGAPPRITIDGTLTNFEISLVGVLMIHFDRLSFRKVDGRKPDVDVDLNPVDGVRFGGPLEFVNTLKDFIPANGFSDPPNLSVTPAGITAGYTLALPAVQVGILSLSNISLGAAFSLPFDGKPPTARFNFAERHNTFNLTVSLFGGGGFVALVVSPDGVKEIEAALEFGASIAINLGVASGSVYVKGGFYFHFSEEVLEFEGYVELGGRLSVLGLISVSLTFHLSLTYRVDQKVDPGGTAVSRLYGQATLTVEIDILFFSASVDVTVEKEFAGSEADPLFIDFIPNDDVWSSYCEAYA